MILSYTKTIRLSLLLFIHYITLGCILLWKKTVGVLISYVSDWIDYLQREKNIQIYDLDYDCNDPIVRVAVKNRRRRRTSFIEPEIDYTI